MNYKLKFVPSALKEWEKLSSSVKSQLKKKLSERLSSPHVPASRLHGFKNHYKIKLRSIGYRLVYEVIDKEICVVVIAIAKRDKGLVYDLANSRRDTSHMEPYLIEEI